MGLLEASRSWCRTLVRCKSRSKGAGPGVAEGGVRSAPGAPLYFPRRPDEPPPDIVPPKLFRIERIKPVKGTTRIERGILREFNIDTYANRVAVVKNIPEHNARLWRVKHLIRLEPITFPSGPPSPRDVGHAFLKENGQCVVTKEAFATDELIRISEENRNDPKRLDGTTIRKECRLKWLRGWGGGIN